MMVVPVASLAFGDLSNLLSIGGVLGAFFIIVALYKSIFHARKAPDEVAADAMKGQRRAAAEDSQRVRIGDPFTAPAPDEPPAPDVTLDAVQPVVTAEPAAVSAAPAARGKEKSLLAFVS